MIADSGLESSQAASKRGNQLSLDRTVARERRARNHEYTLGAQAGDLFDKNLFPRAQITDRLQIRRSTDAGGHTREDAQEGASSESRQLSPCETTHPAVGFAKCEPSTNTGLSAHPSKNFRRVCSPLAEFQSTCVPNSGSAH